MTDIELVIKISEDSYKATCSGSMLPPHVENVVNAIKTGTPLPKGHGRIGDLSELETRISNFIEYYKNLLEETNPITLVYMNHILDGIRYTDTIIEADSAGSVVEK